jgi:hypothetical protein
VRALRAATAAAASVALLAGCPLPQPLPDIPAGQPLTPPRIVVDDSITRVASPESVVRVPAGCLARGALEPTFVLDARLRDSAGLPVVARWFVNYDPSTVPGRNLARPQDTITEFVENDPTLRDLPEFGFPPYQYPSLTAAPASTAGALHVVELVVSNGFHPGGPDEPVPNRSPAAEREVQVYRWVFLTVPESTGCEAGEAGCVRCPEPEPPTEG